MPGPTIDFREENYKPSLIGTFDLGVESVVVVLIGLMESQTCTSCHKVETAVACSHCAEPTCKRCATFLPPDAFAYLRERPAGLEGDVYCQTCFENSVAPALTNYEDLLARAGEIFVYHKNQSKETRLISRKEKTLKIDDIDDRDELLMRLAFRAVESGCNALVDVDLRAIKVGQGGRYRKFMWSGTGIPTNVDPARASTNRATWGSPN